MHQSTWGLTPEPCLNRVPVINQKLFDMLNAFVNVSAGSQGLGFTHSYGENLANVNSVKEAIKKPPTTKIQISKPRGDIKVKKVDSLSVGTCG